jgi:serine/threonine-protein kinase
MPRAIQLGRYHLLDRIAFGGMAEIYRAKTFDEQGNVRLVAIKRVLRHLAEDDEFIQMLVDEARIASMLEHQGIAKVYEFGHVGGDYFIAMEYVSGKDVRTILETCRAEGRWVPPEICAFVVMQTLHGLHSAHELKDGKGKSLNLIHRDVSPSNIICGYDGMVKLCDFGIAKATLSSVQTRAGVIKGKVKYMSPEQALGRKLDRRSDLFSAGSVLYEMLTRVPPFLAPNEMELILKVRDAKYVPVRERNPTIPPALELIVDTAMSRSRSSRYQTALEFARALGDFLDSHARGFRHTHLARFLKSLYRDEIERVNRIVDEYVVVDADEGEVGENLIADSMGPRAEWSKFSPVPTASHDLPTSSELPFAAPSEEGTPDHQGEAIEEMEPPPDEASVSGFISFESTDIAERAAQLESMARSVEVEGLEELTRQDEGGVSLDTYGEHADMGEPEHYDDHHPESYDYEALSDRIRMPVDHDADTALLDLGEAGWAGQGGEPEQEQEHFQGHQRDDGRPANYQLHDSPRTDEIESHEARTGYHTGSTVPHEGPGYPERDIDPADGSFYEDDAHAYGKEEGGAYAEGGAHSPQLHDSPTAIISFSEEERRSFSGGEEAPGPGGDQAHGPLEPTTQEDVLTAEQGQGRPEDPPGYLPPPPPDMGDFDSVVPADRIPPPPGPLASTPVSQPPVMTQQGYPPGPSAPSSTGHGAEGASGDHRGEPENGGPCITEPADPPPPPPPPGEPPPADTEDGDLPPPPPPPPSD